jgi:acetyl esterase/lipase
MSTIKQRTLFVLLVLCLCLSPPSHSATVTLSSADTSAAEASPPNTASVTFTRTDATTSALLLNLIYSGMASNGADIVSAPSTLEIPAGQASATLLLTPIDDTLVEGAETLAVRLAPSPAYDIGGSGFVAILISDNDNATPIRTTGVVFATHGVAPMTQTVKLNVYQPSTGSGPWPVVIYFPGGGWVSQNEGAVPVTITNFTANGFAVVSANYITSTFEKWPAQIRDAKAAVRWVRANAATYGFDPNRIGVMGASSGGHIAAYLAASGGRSSVRVGSVSVDLVGTIGGNFSQSDVVQAAAPFYPPIDLLALDHYPTPDNPSHVPADGLIGLPIQTVPELSATAGAMIYLATNATLPPFWITHGTNDAYVSFNQSELLIGALTRVGASATLWPVQGGGHGPGVIDSPEVISLVQAFFTRVLKPTATNALPVPTFTASALTGTAPLTVNFDASASTDSDGVITKFAWANGDHTGASTAAFSYTYTRAGIYPVTLAVRDDQGGSASKTLDIFVRPAGTVSATLPMTNLSSPTDGAVFTPTGDLVLQANAQASLPASVASVEFLLNGLVIAADNIAPYTATVVGLAPGSYTASARVSDSSGATTTSVGVSFMVQGWYLFCSGFED